MAAPAASSAVMLLALQGTNIIKATPAKTLVAIEDSLMGVLPEALMSPELSEEHSLTLHCPDSL